MNLHSLGESPVKGPPSAPRPASPFANCALQPNLLIRYSNRLRRQCTRVLSGERGNPRQLAVLCRFQIMIRMKDIAKELGLSQATVSKVLRKHPDISEKTRLRVLARVQELAYQPNTLARSLVTVRSFLIGFVAPTLLHPFFAEIARAISVAVRDKGYFLIVSSSEEDPELEREEISRLLSRRLDALVIASAATDFEQFNRMDKMAQPFVLVDRDLTGIAANFVGVNEVKAGRLATEHLIEMGCRRVAHIRGQDNSTGRGRFEGYRQALRHHGVPYLENYVVRRSLVDTETTRQGAEAMRLLLE